MQVCGESGYHGTMSKVVYCLVGPLLMSAATRQLLGCLIWALTEKSTRANVDEQPLVFCCQAQQGLMSGRRGGALLLLSLARGVGAACAITPDGAGHVDVPAGTTSIANSAYKDCTSLVSITFPASLQTVGDEAFKGASNLIVADLESTKVTSIGARAFSDCRLTTVKLPSTLQTTGRQVFWQCSRLLALDLSATSMVTIEPQWFAFAVLGRKDRPHSSGKFRVCSQTCCAHCCGDMLCRVDRCHKCSSLATLLLPPNLEVLDQMAFEHNHALTVVDLSSLTSLRIIGDRVGARCPKAPRPSLAPAAQQVGHSNTHAHAHAVACSRHPVRSAPPTA